MYRNSILALRSVARVNDSTSRGRRVVLVRAAKSQGRRRAATVGRPANSLRLTDEEFSARYAAVRKYR